MFINYYAWLIFMNWGTGWTFLFQHLVNGIRFVLFHSVIIFGASRSELGSDVKWNCNYNWLKIIRFITDFDNTGHWLGIFPFSFAVHLITFTVFLLRIADCYTILSFILLVPPLVWIWKVDFSQMFNVDNLFALYKTHNHFAKAAAFQCSCMFIYVNWF